MNIPIKVDKETKFKWIVEIMSCMQPFKSLRPREKEAVARLLELTYELKTIPKEQRSLLIFHQDNKKRIAEAMGMTIENYYNLILALRKKEIVDEYGIVDKYCLPFMNDIPFITFKFIE